MAEQHTKGPWGVAEPKHPDPRQIEDRLIFATAKGERLHVAEVYQYQNDNNREANGTALANARLIAAAPELMEALHGIKDMAKRYGTVCDDGNSTVGEYQFALRELSNMAQAALAKAETVDNNPKTGSE